MDHAEPAGGAHPRRHGREVRDVHPHTDPPVPRGHRHHPAAVGARATHGRSPPHARDDGPSHRRDRRTMRLRHDTQLADSFPPPTRHHADDLPAQLSGRANCPLSDPVVVVTTVRRRVLERQAPAERRYERSYPPMGWAQGPRNSDQGTTTTTGASPRAVSRWLREPARRCSALVDLPTTTRSACALRATSMRTWVASPHSLTKPTGRPRRPPRRSASSFNSPTSACWASMTSG